MQRVYELRKQARENGHPILRDKSFELLIETIKRKTPKKILEVGTNVGMSSLAMLLSSEDSTLTGIEIDESIAEEAKRNFANFNLDSRAKIFVGDASEIIPILTGGYDFIFLDGPKGHYYEYLTNLMPLLNKGGILFADNVLFNGYVWGRVKVPKKHNTIKNSMEKFLTAITNDEKLKTTIYEIEDGVSITEKLI